jgi:alkylation response protein AidB-like acyl-CoA dehydrogenase
MRSLAFDDAQQELARSVSGLVERSGLEGAPAPTAELWKALGALGVLGLCTPEIGGSEVDVVAALTALGGRLCPGPLAASIAVAAALPEPLRSEVASGATPATLTDGRYVPWGSLDGLVLELADDELWQVVPIEPLTPVLTLSGEPWSSGTFERVSCLATGGAVRSLFELALGAYLVGAARRAVTQAADHARVREQFGRPIGDFQAVAHGLARAYAEVESVADLVHVNALAGSLSGEEGFARSLDPSILRREVERVCRGAVERAHQTLGAMGFAAETGLAATSTRVVQWSKLPPRP